MFFVAALSFFCLSLVLCFGQPVTLIFVFCLITAPFCATKFCGYRERARFAEVRAVSGQRGVGALREGQLELVNGASGTALNVEVRTPLREIAVSPCRSIVTLSPCSTMISSG